MKLSIEFVPRIFSGINVRTVFPTAVWKSVRKQELARANNRCELCGLRSNLHCHEVWSYDLENKIRKLDGFQIMCKLCHQVKHFDFDKADFSRRDLYHHFLKVNQCSIQDYDKENARAEKLAEDVCAVKGKWKTVYGNFLSKKTGIFYCKRCSSCYIEQVLKCRKCGRGKFVWVSWNGGIATEKSVSRRVGGMMSNVGRLYVFTDENGVRWRIPRKIAAYYFKDREYNCESCSKKIKNYNAFRRCRNGNHNIEVLENENAVGVTQEELAKEIAASDAKERAWVKSLTPKNRQKLDDLMNNL